MNSGPPYEALTHSWGDPILPGTFRGVVDETIRDGLQMPYAPPLSVPCRCRLLDHMMATGISDIVVGMVQREDVAADVIALLRHCQQSGTRTQTWVLSRLNLADLEKLARIRDAAGLDVGANVFISVSPLRRFVEDWGESQLLERLNEGLTFTQRHFGQIRVALEDATRTPPASLAAVSRIAAEHSATRFVLADTAGVATPESVRRIFEFVHRDCAWLTESEVALEWHGHNDRGLAVANTLESIACGAHYAHGTILGIGERNGNASLDTILMNLSMVIEFISWEALSNYQREAMDLFGCHLVGLSPVFGRYTFATATGTHCAAARKAINRRRSDLAVLLYSPPSVLSKRARPRFLLSPASGRGTVLAMLEELGVVPSTGIIDALVARVRRLGRTIGIEEFKTMVDNHFDSRGSRPQ